MSVMKLPILVLAITGTLWMQDLGDNFQATADSWPRTIAFYRRHLSTPALPDR
jgi:hypothetical protein